MRKHFLKVTVMINSKFYWKTVKNNFSKKISAFVIARGGIEMSKLIKNVVLLVKSMKMNKSYDLQKIFHPWTLNTFTNLKMVKLLCNHSRLQKINRSKKSICVLQLLNHENNFLKKCLKVTTYKEFETSTCNINKSNFTAASKCTRKKIVNLIL